jgi:hypothetical protein
MSSHGKRSTEALAIGFPNATLHFAPRRNNVAFGWQSLPILTTRGSQYRIGEKFMVSVVNSGFMGTPFCGEGVFRRASTDRTCTKKRPIACHSVAKSAYGLWGRTLGGHCHPRRIVTPPEHGTGRIVKFASAAGF